MNVIEATDFYLRVIKLDFVSRYVPEHPEFLEVFEVR